jgi:hypothetical protein
MRIAIVSGALANKPGNGGNAWTRLQWVLGLRRFGFQVYFVEQISRETCVDGRGQVATFEDSRNCEYFRQICRRFNLSETASLVYEQGIAVAGISLAQLAAVAKQAELLVNISGHLTLPAIKEPPRRKIYFDDDPGYTQFWHASGTSAAQLEGHDAYYTVGAGIGHASCSIPTGGIPWKPTPPLVVLDQWPAAELPPARGFTTIASWRGAYGRVAFAGRTFGQKAHEFRKFVELPQQTGQRFEIALEIHAAENNDIAQFENHGWQLTDPGEVALPDAYQRYIQTSAAEFSVAQGIYIETRSGWFSDRTACYLASGRPALVQDTGFSRTLPVGEGLLVFRTLDEAAEGVLRITSNYERHCRAARDVAARCFDSDRVLGRILNEIGLEASHSGDARC